MWWMSGIFRSVDLLLRPAGGIHDLATVTDFDPATGTGTVEVTVHGADGAPIEATLEVPALDLREDVGPGTVTLEARSEEHTSELQSRGQLVCRLPLEKKNPASCDCIQPSR